MEIKQIGIGRDDRTHRIVKPLGPKHNPRAHTNKTLKNDGKTPIEKLVIRQIGIGGDDRTHRIVKPLGSKLNPRAHANKTLKKDGKNTL